MVMKRTVFLLLAGALSLFGYTDADLDGVDDSVDRCPNTPITDIVDANGCSIKSVIVEDHFDLILGLAYNQYNYRLNSETDTLTTSAQIDWYRGDFSMQLVTSYYDTSGDDYDRSGMNDTTLAAYYSYRNVASVPRLNLQAGVGVIFPTYDTEYGNNNTDFTGTLYLTYGIDQMSIFGGYGYTVIGDDDVSYVGEDGNTYEIRYRNVNSFNAGTGYHFSDRFYASLSYFYADSIYEDVDAIENLSAYGFYSIDAHWFVTGSYAYGLNDTTSDHSLALWVGYYF